MSAKFASDPSDTMSDFQFAPATLTIHVGDTVTWTNAGPTQHSATAYGGSFDTGLLPKGRSASHTFSSVGTFTYFCSIHPFMHGAVVVVAAAGTPSTGSGSAGSGSAGKGSTGRGTKPAPTSGANGSGTTPASSAATPASSAPALPITGLDLLATVILGLTMLGAGMAIRHRISARPR